MNSMRKLFGVLMVLAVATFAMPSMAASGLKLFYAEFPTVAPSAAPQKVSFVIHNESTAQGVSTINSMQVGITSPPPGMTITAVRMTSPTVMTPSMSPTGGGASVILTNFPGIKNHDTATFELTLSNVPPGCNNVTFFVNANSGNAYPQGDEFGKIRTDLLTTGVGCDGVLKCPSLPTSTPGIYEYTEISGGNTTVIKRYENKDGSPCIPVIFNMAIGPVGPLGSLTRGVENLGHRFAAVRGHHLQDDVASGACRGRWVAQLDVVPAGWLGLLSRADMPEQRCSGTLRDAQCPHNRVSGELHYRGDVAAGGTVPDRDRQ